jgi:hypothetical protein
VRSALEQARGPVGAGFGDGSASVLEEAGVGPQSDVEGDGGGPGAGLVHRAFGRRWRWRKVGFWRGAISGVWGQQHGQCGSAGLGSMGLRGRIRVVVDAQRRELYVAGYELREQGWSQVEPLRLEGAEGLQGAADRGGWLWLGPEVVRWFPEGRVLGPSAVQVARLAVPAGPRPPNQWEPIYLRPVQFVKARSVPEGSL